VDDLQGIVEIVEIADQGIEDLLERVERRLLFAGLVGGEHRLGDAGSLRHLVLPLDLPFTQPAKRPAKAVEDRHGGNVSSTSLSGKRKRLQINNLDQDLDSRRTTLYNLTARSVETGVVAGDNKYSEDTPANRRRKSPRLRGGVRRRSPFTSALRRQRP